MIGEGEREERAARLAGETCSTISAHSERGRVALVPGGEFGAPGRGFARLNIGTSEELLAEAVRRMAVAVSDDRG